MRASRAFRSGAWVVAGLQTVAIAAVLLGSSERAVGVRIRGRILSLCRASRPRDSEGFAMSRRRRFTRRVIGSADARLPGGRPAWPRVLTVALLALHSNVATAGEFEERAGALPQAAAAPFEDDPQRVLPLTSLDMRSFGEINAITGPRVLENIDGWEIVARTGGRPFLAFDQITVDGLPKTFLPSDFDIAMSGIPQAELDAHFAAGRGVNRLWFTHPAANGFPIMLAMTPDGFFNPSGAEAPLLMGAAFRSGFIGEPFDDVGDFLQHTDGLEIQSVDDDTLILVFDVHSEAGEGAIELELGWLVDGEKPLLRFRSAHVSRLAARLGFAGLNFLRGPTLFGLRNRPGTPEGGIDAFHDGRSVFLVDPAGLATADLLVPPPLAFSQGGPVVREDVARSIPVGSRLIADQPQDSGPYFSKFPDPPYDQRADLVLRLTGASAPVDLRRAQVAVDLDDPNPEANETANVFLAAEMTPAEAGLFSFELTVDARDFEEQFSRTRPQGVVFRSGRSGVGEQLYFLPLDGDLSPAGAAEPLTDGAITGPARPSVSADNRSVIFDADESRGGRRRRIHVLDLARATMRRVTIDPFGSSSECCASLSSDGTRFAMITNRFGTGPRLSLNVEDVGTGRGPGAGNSVRMPALDAKWGRLREEIAFVSGSELRILDLQTRDEPLVATRPGMRAPAFSPTGERLAYASDEGVHVVGRDGSCDTPILVGADHPTWPDESHLIIDRTQGAGTDLFLVEVPPAMGPGDCSPPPQNAPLRLTASGSDSQPAFVPESRRGLMQLVVAAMLAMICGASRMSAKVATSAVRPSRESISVSSWISAFAKLIPLASRGAASRSVFSRKSGCKEAARVEVHAPEDRANDTAELTQGSRKPRSGAMTS